MQLPAARRKSTERLFLLRLKARASLEESSVTSTSANSTLHSLECITLLKGTGKLTCYRLTHTPVVKEENSRFPSFLRSINFIREERLCDRLQCPRLCVKYCSCLLSTEDKAKEGRVAASQVPYVTLSFGRCSRSVYVGEKSRLLDRIFLGQETREGLTARQRKGQSWRGC
uniref:Uncharacterized protein n=1 Tax=Kalanchoe fedtschenkoi TaxID=63787 RepID=A0A7N1A3H5_KALFE